MNSKSIFHNPHIDFQMLNQSNFEDACSPDDIQGFLSPTGNSLSKGANWQSFLSADRTRPQAASANATPNDTPQSSPATNRKQLEAKGSNLSELTNSKRWFNAHLFATFSEDNIAKAASDQNSLIRKSHSYKNVSNFDINAVGPISF